MFKQMIEKWRNVDAGLLVLRIGVGIVFIITGYMKVSDLPGTVTFFGTMGFSAFWAYLVSFVEFLGGIVVLLGLGKVPFHIGTKLLAITMIVATYIMFYSPTPMMALSPFVLIFATVSLMLSGSGKYSLVK